MTKDQLDLDDLFGHTGNPHSLGHLTKCFYFPDVADSLRAAQEYGESMHCPRGRTPRIFAVNFWSSSIGGGATTTNPILYDETGIVYNMTIPSQSQPGPEGGGFSFDFAILNPQTGEWIGANHSTSTSGAHVIYWPALEVFADAYSNFNTTIVCVACGRE